MFFKKRIGSTSTKEEVFYDNCRDVDTDELNFFRLLRNGNVFKT